MTKSYLVEITWDDARTTGGWRNLTDLEADARAPAYCKSVGWVLGKGGKEKTVTIVQTLSEQNTGTDTITIPEGCIKKIRRLK